jgi:ubiquinone/menaquinone biosynthesis C-methylase UbiE
MKVKEKLLGNNMDRMSDTSFKFMSFLFKIRDITSPEKKLDQFGIKPGDTVIDYGCGPGSYIPKLSDIVGQNGTVYAVDIHELAIDSVKQKISKYNIENVKTILAKDHKCDINDKSADVIYALDMFHMVRQPNVFLRELHRMAKETGKLFIEDGHQPRKETKRKINESKLWDITEEYKGWLVCKPIH